VEKEKKQDFSSDIKLM